MATVTLDGATIRSWEDFHAQSKTAFGFPDYYGDNMDAWMDCLRYLRDDEGMTRFTLSGREVLTIEIKGSDALRQHVPDMIDELVFCVSVLNESYEDFGEEPALRLSFK